MRPVTVRDNIHTVYMYGGTLCVRCKSCDHRAAVKIGLRGNMTTLMSLKLRCDTCNSVDVEMQLPVTEDDVEKFRQKEV